MFVAPQPWLSLAPTTKRPVRRASAMTESRRAREISLALGAAFTISKPSAPAATRESSRPQWLRSYSGSDSTLSAPYARVALARAARAARRASRCSGAVHRQRVAQEDHVRLPGAHLDARAQGRRAGVRPEARRCVLWSVTNTASKPARRCQRRLASVSNPRIERAADIMGDVGVAVDVEHAPSSGAAPASAAIGPVPQQPAADERAPGPRWPPAQEQLARGAAPGAAARRSRPAAARARARPATRGRARPGRPGNRAAGSCSASRRRPTGVNRGASST